jgi:oligosaccharide repeat unit polymerase
MNAAVPKLATSNAHPSLTEAVQGFLACVPLFACLLGSAIGVYSKEIITVEVILYSTSVLLLSLIWLSKGRYLPEMGWGFLLLGHLIWFALPALYQVLSPSVWFGDWINWPVSDDAVHKAVLLVSLFLFFNYLGFHFRNLSNTHHPISEPGHFLISPRHRTIILILLLLVGTTPYFLYGSSLQEVILDILSGRGDKAWSLMSYEAYEGSIVMTIFWISRAFLVSSVVLAGIFITHDSLRLTFSKAIHVLILCTGLVILWFDQGTRSIIMMAVVPFLLPYVLKLSTRGKSLSKPFVFLFVGLLTSVILLSVTQFQLFYRKDVTRDYLQEATIIEIVSPRQQVDFFTETAIAVIVREIRGENYGESPLIFFVSNLVPRVLWEGKPKSEIMWYYSLHRWGIDIWEKGGNALPSIVGQYFIAWGYAGVVWIGALLGFVTRVLSGQTGKNNISCEYLAIFVSAFTYILMSFRFLSPGFHYSTIVLLIVYYLYAFLFSRKRLLTQKA